MRVLALNGSPNTDRGNTALILNPFLEGLQDGGADVETFYTMKLDIQPCLGDFQCWLKTPGRCHQPDDMQKLHPRMREADVWVFASPVYVWGVSGPLKNLMDRIIPLAEPFIALRDGHCTHPMRDDVGVKQVVLVSNCGFWEMDNFDPLLAQMRMLCRVLGWKFAGALLRPHGPALAAMLEMGMPVDGVLEAAHQAGHELATRGEIDPETLKRVSRDLLTRDQYREFANQKFQQELDQLAARSA